MFFQEIMRIIRYPAKTEWKQIAERPHMDVSQLNATVCQVLAEVKAHGDEAVKRYEKLFDHADLELLAVSEA